MYSCTLDFTKEEDDLLIGGMVDRVKLVRHAFAMVHDCIYFQNMQDYRPMLDALSAELKLSEETLNNIVRGYYDQSNIVLFVGKDRRNVDSESITVDLLKSIGRFAFLNNNTDVCIWNGIDVGEDGYLWKPRKVVGVLKPECVIVRL